MNELILEISAFVVSAFCMIDCLKNRRDQYFPLPKGFIEKLKSQQFIFVMLLVCLLGSTLCDVIHSGVKNDLIPESSILVLTVNEVYFLFHIILPGLFTLYILDLTDSARSKGNVFFSIYCIPLLFLEGLIITNPFTKLIFYVTGDAVYHRGSLMWIIYAISGVYIIAGFIFFFANKKNVSKVDRLAIFIIILIATAGIVIQGIFQVGVELFFESTGVLCFLLLLEKRKSAGAIGKAGRINKSFVVIIALIFTTVIAMNITMIYNVGTGRVEKIGETQLSSIKGDLQQMMSESENNLLRYSMGLEKIVDKTVNEKELEKYIVEQQKVFSDLTDGNCFSAYAASPDWTVIPGFDMPKDYHAVERPWYIGAVNNPGKTSITEPYIDADTGNLCYTFSSLLSDGKTVAAMDYNLSGVQDIVGKMNAGGEQLAMIVTDEGIVVGSSKDGSQGEKLSKVFKEYVEVFNRVKASNEHKSFHTKVDNESRIVFSSSTSNGWKLILAVDDSTFYAETVNQIILLGAIDFMMIAVILAFYLVSVNNQEKAEKTLESTQNFITGLSGDIRIPLQDILNTSETSLSHENEDKYEALISIRDSGRILKEKLDNLFSYSSMVRDDIRENESRKRKDKKAEISSRRTRNGIAGILVASLLVGLVLCITMTTKWGNVKINREADSYNSEVTQWMQQKQSILGMFANVISVDPKLLDNYDSAVKWLDDITKNYSEITFAYMANPYNKEHAIIMNNGWVPDEDYKVEERDWYKNTERSVDGFSISTPYFDAQTGLYCITFSKSVYDTKGDFLGVFAIDCLLDKLVDVLDDSYTDDSYAFMVDREGTIINHPNDAYEINEKGGTSVEDTEYANVFHKGNVFGMKDYDGRMVAAYSEKSELSGFAVIVVQSWWSIYGAVIIMAGIFLIMLVGSIIGVVKMINRFIRWQAEARDQLVDAVNKADAAAKAKSSFLAQMSHEIRTPINAVLGMNEMILRESRDNAIRDYAGNIQTAGKNLLALINSILDFSKIEEGKMEILPVKYDTASMINNCVNSILQRAKKKGLEFEAHVNPEIPSSLFGDDMRVTQVTINLLTNAVKYTAEGRVDLYIDGEKRSDGAYDLTVKVKDTGIGIKEEDIGKLFDTFTRFDENRNRNIEGTGLGMAIVNKLLDMMNSKLDVHSVYEEGSEFAFTVKQDIIDDEPIGDYVERVKDSIEREQDCYLYAPEAKLLVVDDNEMNLMVIKNLLKQNGIAPDLALSGEEALGKMKADTYDVILLDHMMPQMDGIETLHKAREEELIPEDCPVIALTANAVVGARESYLAEGFEDYLSKPVDVKELENMLGKHLPDEIVEYHSFEDEAEGDETDSDNPYQAIEDGGINTKDGLRYCNGSDDFFKEMLSQYVITSKEKKDALENAMEAGDVKDYQIRVHALKSNSKSIGATDMFEKAAALEKSAADGDLDTIKSEHPKLMEEFDRIITLLRDAGMAPGEDEMPDESTSSDEMGDDEIIEFMPEEG
ncbi:MAG: response regulator [Eubacterium sp.]|nr:response regulator [Eubacterium sp.]